MALLGNDALLRQLHAALCRGTLSHCLLLTGPEGSGKSELAQYLSAALQCTDLQEGRPCGRCSECRLIAKGIHPDFITADHEKQTIPVDYIRDKILPDTAIAPNQGRKKIYHFVRADDLGPAAQNALLKLIEEPPAYVVFLLESRNPELLLPTVRSRATELRMEPLPPALMERVLAERRPDVSAADRAAAIRHCSGWLGQALALLESGVRSEEAASILSALEQSRRRNALLHACVPLEKLKRDQLLPVMQQLHETLAEALACRSGVPTEQTVRSLAGAVTARGLSLAVDAVVRAESNLQANVSPAHVMGALAVRLADAFEI